MDKVQKYSSFNTNAPSSESYRKVKCSTTKRTYITQIFFPYIYHNYIIFMIQREPY
jgi:hypothetical protein